MQEQLHSQTAEYEHQICELQEAHSEAEQKFKSELSDLQNQNA